MRNKWIWIVLVLGWISCKREIPVTPYYPHILKLSSHHYTYQAWLNNQLIPDEILSDTFFYLGVQNETYFNSIEFLNDTLLTFGSGDVTPDPNNSYRYYYRQDSLFYLKPLASAMLGIQTVSYIEKLIGIGNKQKLQVKWALIGFGMADIIKWGPLYSMGNYTWNNYTSNGSFEFPGPHPLNVTDTMRVLNFTDSYSLPN